MNQRSLNHYPNFDITHPDVLECYRVAGEISYIVKLATHSVESLEKFIDDSMQYGTPSTNIMLSFHEKNSNKLNVKSSNELDIAVSLDNNKLIEVTVSFTQPMTLDQLSNR